ncbi:hypothetical protein DES38_1021, partial [Streptohalobacillus salinus]
AVHFLFLRIKNTPNKVVEFLLFLLSTLLGAYHNYKSGHVFLIHVLLILLFFIDDRKIIVKVMTRSRKLAWLL